MKKEKKIPVAQIKSKLQSLMNYKNIDSAFRALLLCWARHPKYTSPRIATLRLRTKRDGFLWLSEQELVSFSSYCGYDLQ
jgi:hypothetical protein